ncbi:CgeB family protein [Desulfolutivibrio sulfoxidireducens]|uniref:CgeB family protein n=1 Tax=Desulfolutivibrio sulfoxidireducens TaxID=2773299 RepID=UPI00159D99F5|nr:glycosyltransferase [Desulfolutivibrio sulfoxidireducens]QLA16764.1 glycosyltransferase [Desulfolutivibrio sulfoxidireducens]QLA20328.1 glycosyltransferase [Desulfolutivibrio sulfoxidireducens]
MTDSFPYQAEAVTRDGALADVRLTLDGKSRHLFGRAARRDEQRLIQTLAPGGPSRPPPGVLPVLVGSGLGVALADLLAAIGSGNAQTPCPWVAVVDKEAPILDITGLRQAVAGDPRVAWLDHPDPVEVLAGLDALAAATGRRLAALAQPAYPRLHPGYYGLIRQGLATRAHDLTGPDRPAQSPVRDPLAACRYPRFRQDLPRVLLLTSRLFLSGEVTAACARLGAPCRYVEIGADEQDAEDFLARALAAVAAFRPDFVMTFNHLCMDREGVLSDLLTRLELPLASWFADNPDLMLGRFVRPFPSHAAAFTWDADTVAGLARGGCENAFYLPLAADVARFRPPRRVDTDHPQGLSVSFVGNSMLIKTRKRMECAAPHPELAGRLEALGREFGQSPDRFVPDFLAARHPELCGHYRDLGTIERTLAFDTAVVWEATRQYRRDCLARAMPFFPTIVGDAGWLETFPDEGRSWRRLPEMAYYNQLPEFYPQCAVNLNITSRQMKGAVNQRVFDVPACGAFLLTDRQEQMDALFTPGRETVSYAHPDELPDLVRHYLGHPGERRRIALAARRRILAEHSYDRRMETLFSTMRRLFAG